METAIGPRLVGLGYLPRRRRDGSLDNVTTLRLAKPDCGPIEAAKTDLYIDVSNGFPFWGQPETDKDNVRKAVRQACRFVGIATKPLTYKHACGVYTPHYWQPTDTGRRICSVCGAICYEPTADFNRPEYRYEWERRTSGKIEQLDN